MSRFLIHKTHAKFNEWIQSPIINIHGIVIDERWWFIEEFVEDGIVPFLSENGFSLGENINMFKKKLAYWWFYQEQAYIHNTSINYAKPSHRNHKYDLTKFFDTFDSENTDIFLRRWACQNFCDDSSIGDIISSEIRYFIYCYIDMKSSPSIKEIDQILQEENDAMIYREKLIKMGIVHLVQPTKHDYDASELGYFRGDRVMST